MICKQCQTQLSEGQRFCPNCGTSTIQFSSTYQSPMQGNYAPNYGQPPVPASAQVTTVPLPIEEKWNQLMTRFKAGLQMDRIKSKSIAYIGLLLSFIAMFLPAYTVSILGDRSSGSYIGTYGAFNAFLILLSIFLLLCDYDFASTICTGISLFFLLFAYLEILSGSALSSFGFGGISIGMGLILLTVGLLMALSYYILPRIKSRS